MKRVRIENKIIGEGYPCFIIAELGINHNGDIEIAKRMIDCAVSAGCDAVKFQKRTIELVYKKEELEKMMDSPFGSTFGEMKKGLEFEEKEYAEIDRYCKEKKIIWFASIWDIKSVDFLVKFNVPCFKVSSAKLTDFELLNYIKTKGKPIILSTGMSSMEEIKKTIEFIGEDNLIILHCTSIYPAKISELNLNCILTLTKKYSCPIGYSGHEAGVATSVIATVLGAMVIERHITLDRTMWGPDQAASLEPQGLVRLVRDIRNIPLALGDGVKRVYKEEIIKRNKYRFQ